MTDQMVSGLLAVFGGGVASVLLFVPIVAISYRRRGRAGFWWLVGWVAMLVYVVALWTYTLLPLPASEEFRCAAPQLVPFDSVRDIVNYPSGSAPELIRNPAVQQILLNVALFVPLGFFTRAMFRRGLVVATLGGFLASLLIELTQVTGVWGLFHCAYRFFDVDDLMANTLGALLGSLLALLVVRRSAAVDASLPTPVTAGRRFLGMLSDWMILGFVGGAIVLAWRILGTLFWGLDPAAMQPDWVAALAVWLPLGAQLVSVLTGGATLGERVVLLRTEADGLPAWLGRPLRFLFGIGGYGLLMAWSHPASGPALSLFVLGSVIAVWATRDRRGLACVLSGSRVRDRRGPESPAPPIAAPSFVPTPPSPPEPPRA
ncbi:VanZ family protein [Leucobacter sp. M11]|uniref:VanZ family protein n=1 Tax=Leucobacter sp. M11 TaxID=2993565 RepID=UPI002D7F5AA6|nr:VanZ family protein [Leucobacter sp. M11]MEB4615251.1 VanZ family protein [Leucobacter sp. M11]